MPSASFLAHRELAFMNPMGEAATDAAIAALDLPPGARVVETGCGSAELLLRVLEAYPGATGVGVDPDRDGLAVAAAEAARRVPGREPRLVAAPAQDAGLPAEAFDLVVNVAASHAHGGFPEALAELRALARRGGAILLGEGYWTTAPSPEFLEALGGATADELPLGAGALQDAVRAAGLEVLAAATASPDDVAAYEEGLAAAAERLPGDEAAAYARRIRERRALPGGATTFGFALLTLRRPAA
jgi:SAM-dependent methyltransferase